MDHALMKEFEELEGAADIQIDESLLEDNDGDESFRSPQASALTQGEVQEELIKRQLKVLGFPDTDRDTLQAAYDEEFKRDLEFAKARRKEEKRQKAMQAGLQKRRMLMEKSLQEEQDELCKNHQLSMLIQYIKENKLCGALRLDVNSITARSLAKSLVVNNTVTCLDLTSSSLSDHAGSYIGQILKKNTSLKRIELDNNKLGSKSCQSFSDALKVNTSIIYLSFDSNPMFVSNGTSSIKALTEALVCNKTLSSLNLWKCGIDPTAGAELAEGIKGNETILMLEVGNNNINLSDIKKITEALDRNASSHERRLRQQLSDDLVRQVEETHQREIVEADAKQVELQQWLEDQKERRAEEKRVQEEARILEVQQEYEEKRKRDEVLRLKAKAEEEEKALKKGAKGKGKKK